MLGVAVAVARCEIVRKPRAVAVPGDDASRYLYQNKEVNNLLSDAKKRTGEEEARKVFFFEFSMDYCENSFLRFYLTFEFLLKKCENPF